MAQKCTIQNSPQVASSELSPQSLKPFQRLLKLVQMPFVHLNCDNVHSKMEKWKIVMKTICTAI